MTRGDAAGLRVRHIDRAWGDKQNSTGMARNPDKPDATSFAELGDALSGFFDPEWYLSRYPDVATSGFEPMLHFVH